MQLVVDTNIAVAALLRSGKTRELLFSENFGFCSPDWLKEEVMAHKQEFMKKGSLGEEEFLDALDLLLENINIYPLEEYRQFRQKALMLCPKGHEKDWPFLALAIKLQCPLWTSDSALKKQAEVKIIMTEELAEKSKA